MKSIWTDYIDDVLAVYSKRDCPGSEFECRGSVKISGDRFLFVPHNLNLKSVEAFPE